MGPAPNPAGRHFSANRPRHRALGRFLVPVPGLLLTCACLALAQHTGSTFVSVVGQVTTEGGNPIPSGVVVSIQGDNGITVAQQPADSQGHFQIDNLLSGRRLYRLTVKADGYYPREQSLDLRDGDAVLTVKVVLTRLSKTATTGEAPPPLTDMSAPRKARKAYDRGVRELEAHRLAEAQRDFESAVQLYPCYARAQTSLAAVLISKRDLASAETALRKAIQCDPGFGASFASLGMVLNNEKRFTESEAALTQGLRTSPGAWMLYDELAAAHYNEAKYAEATDEWLRAVSLNPDGPSDLHAKLAAAYLRQGNADKACAEMRTYLRLDPDGRFAAQARSLIHQIETTSAAAPALETKPNP
jgi:tetratricopeptide (TPR) repeat protein